MAQFLAAGFLVLAAITVGTGELSERAAKDEAIADALATTELLAGSVAEPAVTRGLVEGDVGAIDRFSRRIKDRLEVGDVKRVKIWNRDGRIVYSDQGELINETFELGEKELRVLNEGDTAAGIADPNRLENRLENRYEFTTDGGLLEVYDRIESPEGEPLLFEVYYSAEKVGQRQETIFAAFRPITLGGLLLLLALTTPLLWILTRRLKTSADDRERLLRAAVDASDSERRRIARDLHDGVVQDLVGTSYALTATGEALRSERPETASDLERMSGSLRTSLRSLRSLLVEIYPPELHTGGLAASLEDLVAPAHGAGVEATVEVTDIDGVKEDVVALVWRVAQEAVRNALRHGQPDTLAVNVNASNGAVVLEVTDDGRGFEPGRVESGDHFGLRGMRDLIRDAGGRLDVRSSPGTGTTVRLEVKRG
ncbi:MAG TPA: sensor histidine kinase [Nocardioidaceae bacterium]|nr:sensor histidine kinase [Nocardioidaceae bacterium]